MAGTVKSLYDARQVRHREEERKRKIASAKRAKERRRIQNLEETSSDSSPLPRTMGGHGLSSIPSGEGPLHPIGIDSSSPVS
jgi:hypothetical protein